jgi:hypothetical protein
MDALWPERLGPGGQEVECVGGQASSRPLLVSLENLGVNRRISIACFASQFSARSDRGRCASGGHRGVGTGVVIPHHPRPGLPAGSTRYQSRKTGGHHQFGCFGYSLIGESVVSTAAKRRPDSSCLPIGSMSYLYVRTAHAVWEASETRSRPWAIHIR